MKRIHDWATAILVIPRWLLTVKYALFAVYGVVAAIAGAPSLYAIAGETYAFYWAIALTISALFATGASLNETKRSEAVEKWSAVAVVALMSANLFGAISLVSVGDLSRAAFSVLILLVTLLPAARAAALIVATTPRDKFRK